MSEYEAYRSEVYWRNHLNVLWKYYVQRTFFGQLWAWVANNP